LVSVCFGHPARLAPSPWGTTCPQHWEAETPSPLVGGLRTASSHSPAHHAHLASHSPAHHAHLA
jgi:hypothetical protein